MHNNIIKSIKVEYITCHGYSRNPFLNHEICVIKYMYMYIRDLYSSQRLETRHARKTASATVTGFYLCQTMQMYIKVDTQSHWCSCISAGRNTCRNVSASLSLSPHRDRTLDRTTYCFNKIEFALSTWDYIDFSDFSRICVGQGYISCLKWNFIIVSSFET